MLFISLHPNVHTYIVYGRVWIKKKKKNEKNQKEMVNYWNIKKVLWNWPSLQRNLGFEKSAIIEKLRSHEKLKIFKKSEILLGNWYIVKIGNFREW